MSTSDSPTITNPSPAELFGTPKLSIDRLPQLRSLFERVSVGCVENFKELITAPVTCYLNQVEAGDSWDLLDAHEGCIAALFYVSEWDTQILIAMEKRMLAASIDAMFGGDGSEAAIDVPNLTTLELNIARNLLELAAGALRTAFAPLAEISVALERIDPDVEFNILGPQNVPSVFAQLLVQIFDSGGRLFVLVPRAPLMPLRKKLERGTLKEAQIDDPRWTRQLQTRVATTHVNVRALTDGPWMTLGDVSKFSVGQVLPLESIERAEIVLTSGPTAMFKCGLGQLDGRLSVKIESPIEASKGLTENVLTEAMRGWGSASSPRR